MDMGLIGSGSWWWTGNPGMLQCMGSQRARYWATEQQQSIQVAAKCSTYTYTKRMSNNIIEGIWNKYSQSLQKKARHDRKRWYTNKMVVGMDK